MASFDLYYMLALAIYVAALYRLRLGLMDSTAWFLYIFAFSFSQNIFGYLFALFSNPHFVWLREWPTITLHNELLLVAMISALSGHLAVRNSFKSLAPVAKLPPLVLGETFLTRSYLVLACSGLLVILILTTQGYYGYYINIRYLAKPPRWLDLARLWISLSAGFLFVLQANSYQIRGRLGRLELFLSALWVSAGVLTGFKSMVVGPILTAFAAAWIARKHRVIHLVALTLTIAFAYAIIEPLRVEKQSRPDATILSALWTVLFEESSGAKDSQSIAQRFAQRMDLSSDGVRVLSAHEKGQLSRYEERLAEYFRLWPIIAVVPRAIWEDKPLANIGAVLYQDLTGARNNSITPSLLVTTYIYGGWPGMIAIYIILGIFITLGGEIIRKSCENIILYAPWLLYGWALSSTIDIMADSYILIFRVSIIIAALFFIGMLRTVRQNKPSG
jgi:hypothetical protein